MKTKMKNLMVLVLMGLLVDVVAFSGCIGSEEKQDNFDSTRVEETDFFPLEKGNMWEYRITILQGGDYYLLKNYIGEGEGPSHSFGRTLKQGVFSLKYEIVEKEGNSFKLRIEKDDLELFEGSNQVDFLYSSGIVQIRVFKEERILNTEGFTIYSCVRYMDRIIAIGDEKKVFFIMEPNLKSLFNISVQGGTFKDCIEQTSYISPENSYSEKEKKYHDFSDDTPLNKGWKTTAYFAPDIGLVKSIQTDLKGNTLNTVELISYKIN